MKFSKTLLMVVISGLGLYSCTKGGDTSRYYMNATVAGNEYAAANCVARHQGSALIIEGLGNSSNIPVYPYISIVLANYNGAIDSNKLDSTMRGNYAEYFTSATDFKVSAAGVVVINSRNATTISGNFQFACTKDSSLVTGGNFVAQIQQ